MTTYCTPGGMGGKVSSASPGGCYCDKGAKPDNQGQRGHSEL